MAKHKPWSTEDDDFISNHYENLPVEKVASELGRHPSSIKRRAKRLGVDHKSSWRKDQHEFVRAHLPTHGFEYVSKNLGKTEEAVRLHARRHNIPMPNARTDYWTPQEDADLIKNLPFMTYSQIGKMLDRTQEACRQRFKKLEEMRMSELRERGVKDTQLH